MAKKNKRVCVNREKCIKWIRSVTELFMVCQ